MKKVLCIDNRDKEELISKGKIYTLLEEDNSIYDELMYLIKDDTDYETWCNASRFIILNEDYKKELEKNDIVNYPKHYMGRKGIETINFIENSLSESEFKGYLKGNIIKYISRSGKKLNYIEDLEKAKWYINKLEEVLENEE